MERSLALIGSPFNALTIRIACQCATDAAANLLVAQNPSAIRETIDGVVLGPVNGTWQKLPMLSRAEFYTGLDAFIKLLGKERNERAAKMFPNSYKDGEIVIGFDEGGERFVRVWKDDSQKSVCYFVEKDTGIIFGAKGWKAFNPNNEYGTLHTISEWSWGEYYGVSKKGLKTLTPRWCRRK